MKKSKAIKKLNKYLKDWEGSCLSDGLCGAALLEFVTNNLNMLPPPINGTVSVIENDDKSITIPVWGWEQECLHCGSMAVPVKKLGAKVCADCREVILERV